MVTLKQTLDLCQLTHLLSISGSRKYPVTWDDKGAMCTDCDVWYHIVCQDICNLYSALGSHCVAWTCGANYSSALFNPSHIRTSNIYKTLSKHNADIDPMFNSIS